MIRRNKTAFHALFVLAFCPLMQPTAEASVISSAFVSLDDLQILPDSLFLQKFSGFDTTAFTLVLAGRTGHFATWFDTDGCKSGPIESPEEAGTFLNIRQGYTTGGYGSEATSEYGLVPSCQQSGGNVQSLSSPKAPEPSYAPLAAAILCLFAVVRTFSCRVVAEDRSQSSPA